MQFCRWVRVEVLTAVNITSVLSWDWRRVISYVNANVSDKHSVSIFRAEATKLENGGLI
jgi:hypothetical protein